MYDTAARYAGRGGSSGPTYSPSCRCRTRSKLIWADVFLLDRFPCKMVELVGWVAGVDDKEKAQTIYCKLLMSSL